jgi:hypothetical protein
MPSSNRKRTSTRETSAEARHDGGMRDPTGFSEASWQSIVVVLDMQASMQFGAQYTMMDHEKSIHTVRMGVSPGFDDESGSLSPPDFEFPREQLRSQPSSVSSLAAPTPSPENLLGLHTIKFRKWFKTDWIPDYRPQPVRAT